jgi:hypothetical protein
MTLLLKDPAAQLDYAVDWGADYLTDDLLIDSGWAVAPAEEGGVAVTADGHDATVARVTVTGGIAGRLYRLTNQVTTSCGRRDARSITIRVEQR